jgi:hypothetical protein
MFAMPRPVASARLRPIPALALVGAIVALALSPSPSPSQTPVQADSAIARSFHPLALEIIARGGLIADGSSLVPALRASGEFTLTDRRMLELAQEIAPQKDPALMTTLLLGLSDDTLVRVEEMMGLERTDSRVRFLVEASREVSVLASMHGGQGRSRIPPEDLPSYTRIGEILEALHHPADAQPGGFEPSLTDSLAVVLATKLTERGFDYYETLVWKALPRPADAVKAITVPDVNEVRMALMAAGQDHSKRFRVLKGTVLRCVVALDMYQNASYGVAGGVPGQVPERVLDLKPFLESEIGCTGGPLPATEPNDPDAEMDPRTRLPQTPPAGPKEEYCLVLASVMRKAESLR